MDPVKVAPIPERVRENKVCETCVWWRVEVGSEYRGGDCRKREPVVGAMLITTDGYSEKPKEGTWPVTKKDDWCGAWNSKQPPFVQEPVREAPVVQAQP